MINKLLWLFVVALLAVDIALLVQKRRLNDRWQSLRSQAAVAMLKADYADEEEALLLGTGVVPAAFPRIQAYEPGGDAVQFFLLASIDDCTNCIEDEVTRLNQLVRQDSKRITGVRGFFVDEGRREMADRFIAHLSPAPIFPMSVRDALTGFPGATTPLVLVIRSGDGRILDAHKPIPQDLTKRDAFYARWSTALGMN